jgi:hypothetical protein
VTTAEHARVGLGGAQAGPLQIVKHDEY